MVVSPGNGIEPEHESAVEAALALDFTAAADSPLPPPPVAVAAAAAAAAHRKHSPPRHPHPHITKETLEKHGAYSADFKGEALTFKVRGLGEVTFDMGAWGMATFVNLILILFLCV